MRTRTHEERETRARARARAHARSQACNSASNHGGALLRARPPPEPPVATEARACGPRRPSLVEGRLAAAVASMGAGGGSWRALWRASGSLPTRQTKQAKCLSPRWGAGPWRPWSWPTTLREGADPLARGRRVGRSGPLGPGLATCLARVRGIYTPRARSHAPGAINAATLTRSLSRSHRRPIVRARAVTVAFALLRMSPSRFFGFCASSRTVDVVLISE
jgi:hypothetical protein